MNNFTLKRKEKNPKNPNKNIDKKKIRVLKTRLTHIKNKK